MKADFEQDSHFFIQIMNDEDGDQYDKQYFTAEAAMVDARHLAYHTGKTHEVWEHEDGVESIYDEVTPEQVYSMDEVPN
jgi:hypothetical protein